MTTQIDNVGIGFVCNRYKPKTTVRTFKGSCGSYTRLTQTEDRKIVRIQNLHNSCKPGCAVCIAVTDKAKKLLQSGK